MTFDRLPLALENGDLIWPESGRVLVLRARGDGDYAALGGERVLAVQGFAPDHDRLAARGVAVDVAAEGDFAAALVQIVKSKAETLSLVAEALAHVVPGGIVAVDGQKDEGIESILKAVKKLMPVDGTLSKAHGKLFWLTRPRTLPEALMDWVAETGETADGFVTGPGMFSPDGADQGSEVLLALVPQLSGRVADLGAGWGYLSAVLLEEQPTITAIDLIEAEFASLEAARMNVTDPRARFFWADVTGFEPEQRYDAIVSNPPFHAGRSADPALGQAFIAAAARMLKPTGQFFMVANQHLPYETTLKQHFGTGKLLAEIAGYKLYQAGKPKGARRG
ncbi:class I SAM-dependent methyltransferase [Nioella nitratireducens]|uniref:class I SAM-dependent methyltransferase n=1 Tax=Nioella nitratireducens TaxID=1287720 RepID=UPI0008FD4F52|nr:class I SAM-dependent methyltransferase [Nioella nitratireducens]